MALTQVSTQGIKDGTITNADIGSSAAIAGTKISTDFGSQNITTTGDLSCNDITLSGGNPEIFFTDNDGNPDYRLHLNNGLFQIHDQTNNVTRFQINTDGHIDVGHLDVGSGLDVTGDISVSGTVDGVDVAALSSTVSGLSNTTINANAANRVITGSNTANTLNGEGELTFASSKLSISATTQGLGLNLKNTSNEYTEVKFDAARTGAESALGILTGRWNNQHDVAQIYLQSGDDTTNKDDGRISFNTQSASGSSGTRIRIEPDGKVGIGTTSPSTILHVNGTVTATAYAGDGSNLTGVSAGATGGGSDEVFYENSTTVTTSYSITSNKNAMSAGPISINNSVTVTVPSGSVWTIV